MLIPVKNSIGVTSINITLINFLKKQGLRILFFKPFSEKNKLCCNVDDTSYLLKKYFSINSIFNIQKKKDAFITQELYENDLIKRSVKLYFKYKDDYDIIFIEGIKTFDRNIYIHNLNIKLMNHIDVELIFYISQNNNIEDFLKKLYIYKNKKYIKNKILNIIINNINFNCNSIYMNNFLISYNENYDIPDNIVNIVSKILINKKLLNILIYKIFYALKIYLSLNQKKNIYLIKSFILYQDLLLRSYKYCNNHSVILVSFNKCLIKFFEKINNILNHFNIYAILCTDILKSDIFKIDKWKKKLNINIDFFYTHLTCQQVLRVLKTYNISFKIIDQLYIDKILYVFNQYLHCHNIFYKNYYNNSILLNNISPFLFKEKIFQQAKKIYNRILLPEGEDIKIIKAAAIISNLKIAQCILLGDPKKIFLIIKKENIHFFHDVKIINPIHIQKKYIETLFLLRHHKGMTKEIARVNVKDNMILSTLMLYCNEVDGIVCGIKYSSSDVLRPAFQLIGTSNITHNPSSLVSSIFFMLFDNYVAVYGDCAINIDPNVEQLSEIAIASANLASKFYIKPRIAMLSYSTGISGSGRSVDKVKQATILVKKKRPDLIIDGPIQYDAAVNILTARIKSPHSPLHGNANIFIFPDLNSGNITYKAVQQSSKIISIGPILQGLKKPVNDLSRGSSIDDIVYTIAITAIQSNK